MRMMLGFIVFVLLSVGAVSMPAAVNAAAAPKIAPKATANAASAHKTAPKAAAKAPSFGERISSLTEVTGIRFSIDGEGKARVVVDAQRGELKFKQSAVANPNRIIVDIENAWLSQTVGKETVIGGFVKKIRAAQFDKTTVRIVAETDAQKDAVHVFTLANPERLVMDFGKAETTPTAKPVKQTAKTEDKGKTTTVKPPVKSPVKQEPASTNSDSEETEKPVPAQPAKTNRDQQPVSDDEQEKSDKDRTAGKETGKSEKDEGEDEEDGDERIAAIIGMKGKVVCIDAGHGGADAGAIGPNGVTEKSITLRVATELKKLLEKESAKVIMTRTSDKAVHTKGGKASAIEELQARCDVANKKKADIFISIHMDAFTNDTAKGTTAYYYEKGAKESKKLADALRVALVEELETEDRGTQGCNFYVVRKTDMPAVLVELAFISNGDEEKFLDSDKGIKKAAQGLLDGIADYFG